MVSLHVEFPGKQLLTENNMCSMETVDQLAGK